MRNTIIHKIKLGDRHLEMPFPAITINIVDKSQTVLLTVNREILKFASIMPLIDSIFCDEDFVSPRPQPNNPFIVPPPKY